MKEKPRIKKTFDWVQRELPVKPWHRKLSSGSERTAIYYAYNLQRLLEERKQTPEQFIEYCKSKYDSPKATGELWVELRDQAYEFKPSQVKMVVKAFRSFLTHHGVFLPAERLPTPKPSNKKELAYDELKKIVALCPEPYRTIFTIFTYAPMGEVSFIEWNNNDDMTQDVQRQLSNRKDYVKVVHPPRKNARFSFCSLIPKTVIQDYLDRGGTLPFKNSRDNLVTDYNLQKEWRSIREHRAGYKKHKGVGVHEIRDAWFTWAGTPQGGKLDWDYRKFAIGHSQFSEQEYNKLWESETAMADQLRRAWAARDSDPELAKKVVQIAESTRVDLEARDRQLAALRTEMYQGQLAEGKKELEGLVRQMSNPFMVSDGTGYKPMYSREELAEAIPPSRPTTQDYVAGFLTGAFSFNSEYREQPWANETRLADFNNSSQYITVYMQMQQDYYHPASSLTRFC